MLDQVIIRELEEADSNELASLFFDTVRKINIADYSKKQIEVWAPENRDLNKWLQSFKNKYVYVAVKNNNLIGFAELEKNGHIDRFYIEADYVGQGVGRILYNTLEKKAKLENMEELFVEASITAKIFFSRLGFILIKEQTVTIGDVTMNNFFMKKKP